MREDLLELICCPNCKADLRLAVAQRGSDGEILEGTLTCVHCGHPYPIEDGIPNLLPPEVQGDSA